MKTIASSVLILLSVALIAAGIAVVLDYLGLSRRVADYIAGPGASSPSRPAPSTDRLWGALPITLGLATLDGVLDAQSRSLVGLAITLPLVVGYFGVVMWLGWIYTPPERRAIGPAFWFRRAAFIPACAFFAWAGITSVMLR